MSGRERITEYCYTLGTTFAGYRDWLAERRRAKYARGRLHFMLMRGVSTFEWDHSTGRLRPHYQSATAPVELDVQPSSDGIRVIARLVEEPDTHGAYFAEAAAEFDDFVAESILQFGGHKGHAAPAEETSTQPQLAANSGAPAPGAATSKRGGASRLEERPGWETIVQNVQEIDDLIHKGVLQKEACQLVGIDARTYRRYKNKMKAVSIGQ